MTQSDVLIILAVAGLVIIGLLATIAIFAGAMAIAFAGFVQEKLEPIIAILMFIVFPPTFAVFLTGYFLVHSGLAEALFKDKKNDSETKVIQQADK